MTAPTPAGPVIEPSDVVTWLELRGTDAEEKVTAVTAAVARRVAAWCIDQLEPDGTWPPDVVLGATMLAGRLWRRRFSPAGVEAFGEGTAYVRRNDPDVALLLQIGASTPPRVG